MNVAKADRDDLKATLDFLHAAELALDEEKYSICSPYEKWQRNLNDEDPDKKMILGIRKRIAEEEGKKEKNVDERIVMYEFLQRKFAHVSCGNWYRVYLAADLLIEQACDPTEDHLAFYPGMECFHVAPEM